MPGEDEALAINRQGEEAIVQFVISLIKVFGEWLQALDDHVAKNRINSGKPTSSGSVTFTFLSGYDKINNAREKIPYPNLGPKIP